MTKAQNARVLRLDGVLNLRDMGGYTTADGRTTRWGVLFRSGKLDAVGARGESELAQLGLRTVVDLRTPYEQTSSATPAGVLAGAKTIRWKPAHEAQSDLFGPKRWREILAGEDAAKVRTMMRDRYPQFLETHASAYRDLLLALANAQTPLLFHCAAGKDRTGVAAALILALLNVPQECILEDYLLTQRELGDHLEAWMAGGVAGENAGSHAALFEIVGSANRKSVQPLFDADAHYLAHLCEGVDMKYGGFYAYATDYLKVSADQIESIKDHLLVS